MPQAILLQDVENARRAGTVVDVSKGYLRNFLIPRKLAAAGDQGRRRGRRAPREAAERAVARRDRRRQENAELLNKTVLTIAHQAGDDGRLFGSVTSQDIADAIKEARGITIDRARSTSRSRSSTVGTRMVVVEVARRRDRRPSRPWSSSRSSAVRRAGPLSRQPARDDSDCSRGSAAAEASVPERRDSRDAAA